jgi:hypothetical protein
VRNVVLFIPSFRLDPELLQLIVTPTDPRVTMPGTAGRTEIIGGRTTTEDKVRVRCVAALRSLELITIALAVVIHPGVIAFFEVQKRSARIGVGTGLR